MTEPRLTTRPETLREYALIADGERGAVIGPRGDVAFRCAPRWHDDAVFGDLLGGRGTYVVRPVRPRFTWGGSYQAGSPIWRSRWAVGPDLVESREALTFPGDRDRLTLLRRVEAIRGTARVAVLLDCRAAFGAERMRRRRSDAGVWAGRSGARQLRWSGIPVGAAVERPWRARTAGAVHRGVRRRAAPAARQRPASVRPRPPDRDRTHPDHRHLRESP